MYKEMIFQLLVSNATLCYTAEGDSEISPEVMLKIRARCNEIKNSLRVLENTINNAGIE